MLLVLDRRRRKSFRILIEGTPNTNLLDRREIWNAQTIIVLVMLMIIKIVTPQSNLPLQTV